MKFYCNLYKMTSEPSDTQNMSCIYMYTNFKTTIISLPSRWDRLNPFKEHVCFRLCISSLCRLSNSVGISEHQPLYMYYFLYPTRLPVIDEHDTRVTHFLFCKMLLAPSVDQMFTIPLWILYSDTVPGIWVRMICSAGQDCFSWKFWDKQLNSKAWMYLSLFSILFSLFCFFFSVLF